MTVAYRAVRGNREVIALVATDVVWASPLSDHAWAVRVSDLGYLIVGFGLPWVDLRWRKPWASAWASAICASVCNVCRSALAALAVGPSPAGDRS